MQQQNEGEAGKTYPPRTKQSPVWKPEPTANEPTKGPRTPERSCVYFSELFSAVPDAVFNLLSRSLANLPPLGADFPNFKMKYKIPANKIEPQYQTMRNFLRISPVRLSLHKFGAKVLRNSVSAAFSYNTWKIQSAEKMPPLSQ